MEATTEKKDLSQKIKEAFQLRGLENSPVRKNALDQFLNKGLPGSKTEEYKFTPITRALEKVFTADSFAGSEFKAINVPGLKCNVIAFINGVFSEKHSSILEPALTLTCRSAAGETPTDPFGLLNDAFAETEVNLSIGAGKILQHPIAILHHFTAGGFVFANPRWSLNVGKNAEVSMLELTFCEPGAIYFNNRQSFTTVGENAGLEYTLIQNNAGEIQVNNSTVTMTNSSRAACFTFTFDGQLVRNNLTLCVDGQGADAHLYGLYLLSKHTIADNHTVVDHRQPNSSSNELYKGVMDGNSKGVFNGKIYVRPDAQKTNAFQSNRNLLLSETATINTKPQLEIWADDVKCSHGCTTGQLDEEALFYLRSRGIPKEQARGMMLSAFATETLASLKNDYVRDFVSHIIAEKLHHGA